MDLGEKLFNILKSNNDKLSMLELEISDDEFWSNKKLHIEELKEKYPNGKINGETINNVFERLCKNNDKLALLELEVTDEEFWNDSENHIDNINSFYSEEDIQEYINFFEKKGNNK